MDRSKKEEYILHRIEDFLEMVDCTNARYSDLARMIQKEIKELERMRRMMREDYGKMWNKYYKWKISW